MRSPVPTWLLPAHRTQPAAAPHLGTQCQPRRRQSRPSGRAATLCQVIRRLGHEDEWKGDYFIYRLHHHLLPEVQQWLPMFVTKQERSELKGAFPRVWWRKTSSSPLQLQSKCICLLPSPFLSLPSVFVSSRMPWK